MIFLLTALCDNKATFTGIRSLLRRESFQVIMMIYRLLGSPYNLHGLRLPNRLHLPFSAGTGEMRNRMDPLPWALLI